MDPRLNEAIDLIYSAKKNGIEIILRDNEKLQLKVDENRHVDEILLNRIREKKEAIIELLGQENWKSKEVTNEYNEIARFDRNAITYIPLSYSQERLWFIDRLEGSVQYHMPSVLRIKGKLNEEALSYTLHAIIDRHEVLRTVIREKDGSPYQHVLDSVDWELQKIDGSIFINDPEGLHRYIDTLKKEPFNLSKDYFFRAHLISLNADEHLLLATFHHIASDGWSMSVLLTEVIDLYNSFDQKRKSELAPLKLQYADFAVWQRNILEGELLSRKIDYWKNKLLDVKILRLSTDYPRPLVQSTKGHMVSFSIDKDLSDKLLSFSQSHDCTLFMTLLASFKTLLFRYSGQADICVGTAIAGRQNQALESLIGFFVNTLALRDCVDGDASFLSLLEQVRKTTLEAFDNQEVPFEKVVDAVIGQRDLGTDPLVQVMFALQNTPVRPILRLGEANLSQDKYEDNTALFELWLNMIETPNGLRGYVKYCTDLYSERTIGQFIFHFKKILESIITAPEQKVSALEMLSAEERHQLLFGFNNNDLPYPLDKSVVDLFEQLADEYPLKTAVLFEDRQLSYEELNQRANQLAYYLRKKGVELENLIPICIDRSPELIIAILAILKAGGAYVPIDPEYPSERINFMLKDIGASMLLTNKTNKVKFLLNDEIDVIQIDTEWPVIKSFSIVNLENSIQPDSLAYVIYTSGSTGNPKGAMIEHRNIVSLVKGINYVSLAENDILLSTGSPSFDATTIEYWGMLLNGGQLVLCHQDTLLDNELLKDEIEKRKVTKMWFTSSWFNQLVEYDISIFKSLQTIMVGGEKLSEQHIQKMRETYPEIEIINGYGPTENTTFSLTYRIGESIISAAIPIGYPLNNRKAFIVDGFDRLVPVGVPGEILLGGAGIARGYLNRDELTSEKFISNPLEIDVKSKLYRTGDLGKWHSDGTIEYIGRLDNQVKLRGYRIELGEIETALNKLEQVNTSCVVVKKSGDDSKSLSAYFVPRLETVKIKERELSLRLIASWKELYETEYDKTRLAADIDPEFNIIGWNDSFTGQPIPPEQMREWLKDITDVILAEKPQNVLEIGTGTGLIYYQLAGKIHKYIGTDFSRSSMSQISDRIEQNPGVYGATQLQVCAAHEVSLQESEKVDMVILNSIVQYFPSEEYMTGVVAKSISFLKGSGRIIVGDVRDNRLLELFKGRLLIKKLQESVNVKEFKWAIEQDIAKEEELCLSPDYFYKLQSIFPQINHVEIKWKNVDFSNELSLYRFTVVIYVGIEREVIKPDWQSCEILKNRKEIFSRLQQGELVALKKVPNPRLWHEQQLKNGLKNKFVKTVGDILTIIKREDQEIQEVKDFLAEAIAKGYSARLLLDEDPLKINLVLEPKLSDSFIESPYHTRAIDHNTPASNIPLFADISALLQKDVRSLLQKMVPEYMVPSEIISLVQLPLTNNGKVDRDFLSKRQEQGHNNKTDYVPPGNKTERVLADIWQDLLGMGTVSIHDNFFEIGGHSLLATRVISAVRRQLEVEISIKDLFMHPTIASLAAQLQFQSGVAILPPIEVLPYPEKIPLSFSQERIWFIDQLEGSVQYNLPVVLNLKGRLNIEALDFTLRSIVNRHEVLRTVFDDLDGQPFQRIGNADHWQMSLVEGSTYQDDEPSLQKLIEKLIAVPFDLAKDFMLRVDLIILSEVSNVVVVTMHHIASDGWSLPIIVKEVSELYNAYAEERTPILDPLPLQYPHYAIWQRKYLDGEVLEIKTDYWRKKLHDVKPLSLTTDYERPSVKGLKGGTVKLMIEKEMSERLNKLGQQNDATLFMTLLAIYKVLLYRYTGSTDICVGASIANRPQQELEDLIGFFVNTLALRTDFDEAIAFTDLLQKVRTTMLEAYEYQDVPFEKVVQQVVSERVSSITPLFQVMMVLHNTPHAENLDLGSLELSPQFFETNSSKFDITFFVNQNDRGLNVKIVYSTDLFRKETIIRMAGHFKELVNSILKDPDQSIDTLQMLSEEEEQQLLFEYN